MCVAKVSDYQRWIVSIAQSGAVAGGMVVDQLLLLLVTLVSFHPLRSGHGQLPRGTSNDDIF